MRILFRGMLFSFLLLSDFNFWVFFFGGRERGGVKLCFFFFSKEMGVFVRFSLGLAENGFLLFLRDV